MKLSTKIMVGVAAGIIVLTMLTGLMAGFSTETTKTRSVSTETSPF